MIQVTNLEAIKLILTVVSGVCWTIVYVEGIRVGFKDKSYAIPFYALALNIDMFVQRSGGEGQSLYIAVSKWLGTGTDDTVWDCG
jgi:hypothetical protein